MTQAIQKEKAHNTDAYWEKFEQAKFESKQPSWLFPLRKAAMTRFAETGFPTVNDEDWRFTNVAPIARLPFYPVSEYSRGKLDADAISKYSFSGLKGSRLVFVNGHFSKELSSILPQKNGIKIGSLAAALNTDSELVEKHLGRYAQTDKNAFTALNIAFFQDGAFIYVPAGQTVAEPVHLLFVSTATEPGTTISPRNLIIAEKNSKLTVIESFVSATDVAYFTNIVIELVVGENAAVEHCKFQDEAPSAYHIAAVHAHLGRSCNFIAHSIATGAKLSRNSIGTSLADEGVECVLNGLYLTRDEQLADHHMVVEHAKPHCNSHEYYNGILDGHSKGVFHGRILVRPDAQKTDAKQTNKNLLLSDDATIDTKPQLEIYADDVKCTHGATIGQLNDESIFYLRARGIGLEKARQMLIHAFAGEIIDRIRYAPAREEMDKIVWDRLEQNPLVARQIARDSIAPTAMSDDLDELYQQVILDHCKSPRNFHALEGANRKGEGFNPLCGDNYTVFVKMDGDTVSDAAFQGSGCCISKASASLMTDVVKGKSKAEVKSLFNKVHDMVTTGHADEAGVGKLAVFAGVHKFPARVKCAILSWHAMLAAVEGNERPVTTEEEKH